VLGRKPPPSEAETASVDELRLEVESLKRALRVMSSDLDDAINGFYRRRQSDQMREIREEEAAKKPKRVSDRDLLLRAMQRTETPGSDKE
jgi:hypothetical protein